MSIVLAQQEDVKISSVNPVRLRVVKAEVYSRVVGYYRPVQDWNRGKKEEFSLRENLDTRQVEAAATNVWPDPMPVPEALPQQ